MKKFIIGVCAMVALTACGPKKTVAPVEEAVVDSTEVVVVDSTVVDSTVVAE